MAGNIRSRQIARHEMGEERHAWAASPRPTSLLLAPARASPPSLWVSPGRSVPCEIQNSHQRVWQLTGRSGSSSSILNKPGQPAMGGAFLGSAVTLQPVSAPCQLLFPPKASCSMKPGGDASPPCSQVHLVFNKALIILGIRPKEQLWSYHRCWEPDVPQAAWPWQPTWDQQGFQAAPRAPLLPTARPPY